LNACVRKTENKQPLCGNFPAALSVDFEQKLFKPASFMVFGKSTLFPFQGERSVEKNRCGQIVGHIVSFPTVISPLIIFKWIIEDTRLLAVLVFSW